jgi:hypothetical protein
MNDVQHLEQMNEELRRMREKCEPKTRDNPRYHAYSSAISSLLTIIDDLRAEGH